MITKRSGSTLVDIVNSIRNTRQFSILLAEDEAMIREPMRFMMDKICGDVVSAEDGQSAWEVYQQRPFSVVVTDLLMPRMDGIALIQNIRQLNPHQKVIVITAYRDEELMAIEPNPYTRIMQKPLSMMQFTEVLVDMIDLRDAEVSSVDPHSIVKKR